MRRSILLITNIALCVFLSRLDCAEELEATGSGEDLRQSGDNCRRRPGRINIRRDSAHFHPADKAVHIYGNQR